MSARPMTNSVGAEAAPPACHTPMADAPTVTPDKGHVLAWPLVVGFLAVAGLLSLYLGIITLAQGFSHALEQLSQDLWFVAAIAAGFGTQVGLFTYLRRLHLRPGASAAMTATGGGTGTVSMLACCAHHLVDILPILGVSGAALFLTEYKTPLMVLGIVANLAGVVYMLRLVRRQRSLQAALAASPRVLS